MIVAEPALLPPGTEIISGYTVLRHVNRGGMFDVYEVWSSERDCRCAAKAIRPDRVDESKARRRLIAEGRLLLRLTHPNIVRAYELRDTPEPVLILEALPGMTLEYWLGEKGRLPLSDLVVLGEHVCSAVGYLHRRSLLHRDLKPGNLLCSYGIIRVVDFSLARRPGRGRAGAGTHIYLAPEQAQGAALTPATDIWGIGAVLWEAATGRPPFDRDPDDPDRYLQLEQRAEAVKGFRRLPHGLASDIDACLHPDPSARPHLRQLAETLDSCH
jgi:serine/threonine protein kinase